MAFVDPLAVFGVLRITLEQLVPALVIVAGLALLAAGWEDRRSDYGGR